MSTPLLQVRGLTVQFPLRGTGLLASRRVFTAVEEVDLDVADGQAVGIVGESGCGKSTLARAILALVEPRTGSIEWRGQVVRFDDAAGLRRMRRELQVVFQDPVGSLDPRMTICDSVAEALVALEGAQPRAEREARVAAMLREVGLDPALLARYPHELSGGQCQRAAIARSLVARPRLLVCDEVVSALDVSVQAQIVNLLGELRRRHGLALLFISHNLAVVRHLCEEIVVLYLGRVVERAPREAIFARARHPYTRALLAAVPHPGPDAPMAIGAGPAGAASPASVEVAAAAAACAYSPRCPFADTTCRTQRPRLEDTGDGHLIACHHWRSFPLRQ
ncbi:MAG: ATP-binding cassette domain-containing protein [Steroidobacteraceae bacterium]|nr:ATP-binding cassette domain-containing protein [Steroidobacteraceae bacterium]